MKLAPALQKSIANISPSGIVFYTKGQLYYEVCRTLRPKPGLSKRQASLGLMMALLPTLLLWKKSPPIAKKLLATNIFWHASLHFLRQWPYTLNPPILYEAYERALQTYAQAYGLPPFLLPPAKTRPYIAITSEPDLLAYGLPKLLLCANDGLADMLIANDFHIELGCIILSWASLNPWPTEISQWLKHDSATQVYLLHDACPVQFKQASIIEASLGLKSAQVKTLSLRPSQAQQGHLFAKRQTEPIQSSSKPNSLSLKEWQWLQAGYSAKLEALPPEHLLRALRRNMLGKKPPTPALASLGREKSLGFMTWPNKLGSLPPLGRVRGG